MQNPENTTPDIPKVKIWNWQNRSISTSDVALNSQGNTLRVAPGEQFTISFSWSGSTTATEKGKTYYCPNCIVQLYYGIGVAGADNKAQCFVSDIMKPSWERRGQVKGTLTAPDTTGVYYVTQALTLEYNCEPGKVSLSEKLSDAIAVIEVDPELPRASQRALILRSR